MYILFLYNIFYYFTGQSHGFPFDFMSFKLPLPFSMPSPTSTSGFIWEITLLSQFKRRKIPTHVNFVTNCPTILMLTSLIGNFFIYCFSANGEYNKYFQKNYY